MKRLFKGTFLSLLTVSIIASSCLAVFITVDTPGYDIFYSDDSLVSNIFISLKEEDGIAFADVDYKAHFFQYQVEISYDDLASKVMLANQNGFICSLYKNELAGYWVGYVYDVDYSVFDGGQEISGTLCNSSGYVYVAEIDTTGSDSVDLLTQILVRLTLVESYVKSTYFELWEQGGVLDDIYDAIDSIDSYVYDIKDRLYYNGKSAAYYLYKIESHLATIANNSGTSSGSSSGTDLSGITTQLDTLTGLTGIIQLRADAILSSLGVANTYLYEVSTKLDGVNSMVTDLREISWYAESIDADLETVSDLIGSTSLDVDALVTGMGVTQDLIAAANTNLTTLINKQELIFDYLADLSGDLGTVISNQSSVLSVLQQISDRLYYPDAGIDYYVFQIYKSLVNKLDTVTGNQEAVLALLQEDGAFTTDIINALSYDGVSVAQHVRDFSLTAYLNMSFMIDHLSEMKADLDSLHTSLSFYLSNPNSALLDRLDAILGNQPNIDPIIWNQESILTLLQQEGAFTTDLSGVLVNLQELSTTLSNINNALSLHGDRLSSIRTYVASMDTRQLLIQETLSNYSSYLGYKGFTLANYAYQINENLVNKMATVTGNQEAILALLQQDGAFTTDTSGILTDLDTMISNQSTALPVLQSMSESLTTISNRLYYVDASVSYYVYNISRQLRDKLPVIVANQEATIGNQQKLIDLIEDLELTTNVTIENIENITIDVTNKAYEVFYITDSEGNEQNLADFSGDVLTISGRLLNFFFKVAFDDAMDSVDSALDDMTEFYLDDSVVVGGSSLWE